MAWPMNLASSKRDIVWARVKPLRYGGHGGPTQRISSIDLSFWRKWRSHQTQLLIASKTYADITTLIVLTLGYLGFRNSVVIWV